MSATSAYVAAQGGTVQDGLAGVIRVVNRLNEIYENDLGIHLELAEGSDRLIFADAATDPFRGLGSAAELLLRNIAVAADNLPRDGYELGHVLHVSRTASEGLAVPATTCRSAQKVPTFSPGQPVSRALLAQAHDKAAGATISTMPFGDVFYVDQVAHGVAHQFGASHTFNMAAPRRDADSAVEPGAGTTIMAHEGLTPARVQKHRDPYFHAASIAQIRSWVDSGAGTCGTMRINPRPTPVIDSARPNLLTVPASTPFFLTADLSFVAPGAVPTFTFEQMDRGAAQASHLVSDQGEGPLFRSRAPRRRGQQPFPSYEALWGKEPLHRGDTWPTTNRTLNFRVTARDNLGLQAHVVSRDISIRVVDTGEAFQVLSPGHGAEQAADKPLHVTWRVAGTNKPPISCSAVNIFMTYGPGTGKRIVSDVPNTGSYVIPGNTLAAALNVTQTSGRTTRVARILLTCSDERTPFFTLSKHDFNVR